MEEQDRYHLSCVSAYVDRKLTQHIDVHFMVREDDLEMGWSGIRDDEKRKVI